jgi:hypothetical protein
LAALAHSRHYVRENIGHRERSPVESEAEFIDVPLHVLSAHLVIDTVILAFEQGPKTLDGVV